MRAGGRPPYLYAIRPVPAAAVRPAAVRPAAVRPAAPAPPTLLPSGGGEMGGAARIAARPIAGISPSCARPARAGHISGGRRRLVPRRRGVPRAGPVNANVARGTPNRGLQPAQGREEAWGLVANLAGASRGFSAISARPGPRMQPSKLPQPPARPQVPAHRLAPSTRVGGRQPGLILDGRRIYPRRLVYFCQNWGRRRRALPKSGPGSAFSGNQLRGAGIFGPMARRGAAGCARIAAKAARRGAPRARGGIPLFH